VADDSYLLVGNPTARSGKAGELIDEARELLRSRGLEVRFLGTEPRGLTIPKVCKEIDARPPKAVLALGGDGTFAEVARGILLASERVPLGMLPAGTANDQGQSFGLASGKAGLERNVDVVLAGHQTQLDVGRVSLLGPEGAVQRQQPFFDSVGWGMQPEVLEVRNRDRKVVGQIPVVRDLYRDQAVYAGAVLNRYLASWVEPTKFVADVTVDDSQHLLRNVTDIVIKATAVYAGSWVLDRHAEPDDGLFELITIQGRRDWFAHALKDLTAVQPLHDNLNTLGITTASSLPGASFELRLSRPARRMVACQVDGEEWHAGNHFRVEVLPGALPLITPADWTPPWR
jgi:diacylglycerol kinase family enzyme